MKKDSLLNKCAGKTGQTCERMKLEHSLASCTKLSIKWLKDLNVRPDTMKLSEERQAEHSDINRTRSFLTHLLV